MSDKIRLSLIPKEFPDITEEEANELLPKEVKLFFGIGKKPKKSSFDMPVSIETFDPMIKTIETDTIQSISSWYSIFYNIKGGNYKYLIFAKSQRYR